MVVDAVAESCVACAAGSGHIADVQGFTVRKNNAVPRDKQAALAKVDAAAVSAYQAGSLG